MRWRIPRRGRKQRLGPPEEVEPSQLAELLILKIAVDSKLTAVAGDQPADPAPRSANRIIVMLRNWLPLSLPPRATLAHGPHRSSPEG